MNDLGLVNINELKKQFLNKFACLKKIQYKYTINRIIRLLRASVFRIIENPINSNPDYLATLVHGNNKQLIGIKQGFCN